MTEERSVERYVKTLLKSFSRNVAPLMRGILSRPRPGREQPVEPEKETGTEEIAAEEPSDVVLGITATPSSSAIPGSKTLRALLSSGASMSPGDERDALLQYYQDVVEDYEAGKVILTQLLAEVGLGGLLKVAVVRGDRDFMAMGLQAVLQYVREMRRSAGLYKPNSVGTVSENEGKTEEIEGKNQDLVADSPQGNVREDENKINHMDALGIDEENGRFHQTMPQTPAMALSNAASKLFTYTPVCVVRRTRKTVQNIDDNRRTDNGEALTASELSGPNGLGLSSSEMQVPQRCVHFEGDESNLNVLLVHQPPSHQHQRQQQQQQQITQPSPDILLSVWSETYQIAWGALVEVFEQQKNNNTEITLEDIKKSLYPAVPSALRTALAPLSHPQPSCSQLDPCLPLFAQTDAALAMLNSEDQGEIARLFNDITNLISVQRSKALSSSKANADIIEQARQRSLIEGLQGRIAALTKDNRVLSQAQDEILARLNSSNTELLLECQKDRALIGGLSDIVGEMLRILSITRLAQAREEYERSQAGSPSESDVSYSSQHDILGPCPSLVKAAREFSDVLVEVVDASRGNNGDGTAFYPPSEPRRQEPRAARHRGLHPGAAAGPLARPVRRPAALRQQ